MQIANNTPPSRKKQHIPIKVEEAWVDAPDEFLLLQEMTHRINNELTSTIGIIACDAERSSSCDVKIALARVTEHLHDHARIYRALQMPTANRWIDAAAYLRELCQSLTRAKLRHKGVELVLIERPLQLRSVQCWKLGLVVAELITNASRHAFAEGGGVVRVELRKRGVIAECRVTDDGSGPVNIRPGHGLGIIQKLVQGLDGKINQRFGANGAATIVSFPIEGSMPGD
jgi:two-component sensor histidine kinase